MKTCVCVCKKCSFFLGGEKGGTTFIYTHDKINRYMESKFLIIWDINVQYVISS